MAGDETTHHFVGLDLGPIGQFTGLAAVERRGIVDDIGRVEGSTYSVRHLARFPPGTPYGEVIEAAERVLSELPAKATTVVVDQTAVGRTIFELIRSGLKGRSVRGVAITAGTGASPDGRGGMLVAKMDLVGTLQILLQNRRFKVAPSLEHATLLAREFQQFQVRPAPLNSESLLEWRERSNDDLVLAAAVAAWQGEYHAPFFIKFIQTGEPEPMPPWARRRW